MNQPSESENYTKSKTNVIEFINALHKYKRSNDYKKTNWSHAKWIWSICKARAKRNEIEFDISIGDVLVPEFCPVLGMKLKINRNNSSRDSSATIDRLNPNLGYIKGNIAVISNLANRIKSNATAEQIEKVYKWLKKQKIK